MRGISVAKDKHGIVVEKLAEETVVSIFRSRKIHVKNNLVQMTTNRNSKREMNILDYLFSFVDPSDEELPVINTSIREICSIMGFGLSGSSYDSTRKALKNLTKTGYQFHSNISDKIIHSSAWLKSVSFGKDDLQVSITLNPVLANYLIFDTAEGGFTQYTINDTLPLNSKYTLDLFKLIKSFKNLGGVETTPKEIMNYFMRTNDSWSTFRNNYLKPAVDNINNSCSFEGFNIVINTILRNRKVAVLQLRLERIPVEELPIIPMFNWLDEQKKD